MLAIQRITGFIPLICAFVAMVLSVLCLFAGHKPDFMQDYCLVTVSI